MIHIFIGTKAQFIKTAPVIHELEASRIPYRLIDTNQHTDITTDLRKIFSIKSPDASLDNRSRNVNTLMAALNWSARIIFQIIFQKESFRRRVFGDVSPNDICVIHGDTLSTLLGLIASKSCGIRVAHLEAGLRSFDIFHPFPEEIIRIICMKHSDILFAPSKTAEENLRAMKLKGSIYNIGANTVLDSIRYVTDNSKKGPDGEIKKPYVIMSIHRFENIYNKRRLLFILTLMRVISQNNNVLFVLHQPTMKRITRIGFGALLKGKAIMVRPIVHYDEFVTLLEGAEFIVTDGGSIQEESSYLGIPCLIARLRTERDDGIGKNAVLSRFNPSIVEKFLASYRSLRRDPPHKEKSPSKEITSILNASQFAKSR